VVIDAGAAGGVEDATLDVAEVVGTAHVVVGLDGARGKRG
jgi:hypothetical protein